MMTPSKTFDLTQSSNRIETKNSRGNVKHSNELYSAAVVLFFAALRFAVFRASFPTDNLPALNVDEETRNL